MSSACWKRNWRQFAIVTLITSLWIHLSETFRYFVFVLPDLHQSLAAIEGVGPMNVPVFLTWVVWDTLLTAMVVLMVYLFVQHFGDFRKVVIGAATVSWIFFFLLFWVGIYNMGISGSRITLIALPLAWVEMIVASFIAAALFRRFT